MYHYQHAPFKAFKMNSNAILSDNSNTRRWLFTLNNYTEEEEISLQELECSYLVYGREIGKDGTPHLQGFVTFKNTKRFSAMKKVSQRAHWEAAKSSSKINRDYCMKGSQPKDEWEELNVSGPNYGVD